uniref:Neuronal acetylcholine receptor subunit alpha-6 n=1 Tax=Magallana gigas TaxID=29159 RepID=K1Q867_MAGGI
MRAIYLVLTFCLLQGVEGYSLDQETQLHANLTTKYERKIRPFKNQTEPIQISMDFYMEKLKEFSEKENKISVVGSLSIEWKDFRLTWDPTDYDGDLNQTSLFVSDIWAPNLFLLNPYEKQTPILSDGTACTIQANGYVTCLLADNFETTCSADISNYPFDTQICTLKFYVQGSFASNTLLQNASSTIRLDLYEIHGLWYLTGTRNYVQMYRIRGMSCEVLQLELKMKRRNSYCVYNILLPIFFLNLIQLFVFFLPLESGERVGFSMTVLLSVVVFFTIIQSKLPEFSKPSLSPLTFKLLVDFLTSIFIVLFVVVITFIYHKKNHERIPRFMREYIEKTKEKNGNEKEHLNITWKDVAKLLNRWVSRLIFVCLYFNFSFYMIFNQVTSVNEVEISK